MSQIAARSISWTAMMDEGVMGVDIPPVSVVFDDVRFFVFVASCASIKTYLEAICLTLIIYE